MVNYVDFKHLKPSVLQILQVLQVVTRFKCYISIIYDVICCMQTIVRYFIFPLFILPIFLLIV